LYVNLKLSSLIGSLVAIIILVLGNYFNISSLASIGDMYGLVFGSALCPIYDSKHIFKKGKGSMGSSNDNNNDGAKFNLDKFNATN
jgi:hypothetical protein